MRGGAARVFTNLLWLVAFGTFIVIAAFLSFISGVLFERTYPISVPLPEAGGVLPGQEVTVLGRAVGQVEKAEVTPEGVLLRLRIVAGQSVPEEARVVVLRRSPIGEQAVDFQPLSAPWTPAEPGATVVPREIVVPEKVPFLLERAERLFAAVDPGDLGTLIHELAVALEGRAETLRSLNRDSLELNRTLVAGIPEFERLIDESRAVLAVLRDHRQALAESFTNAADLSETLAANRPNLERLLDTGRRALTQADALIRNERADVSCLISDVTDLNEMMLGPSTADGAPAALYSSKLDEFEQGLVRARFFFTGFDIGTQFDPQTGATWARIKLVLTEEAGGQVYPEKRPTPPTRPGAACESPFGTGVNAVGAPGDPQDRTDPSTFEPPDPTSPGIEWAPVVEPRGPQPITPPPGGPTPPPIPATGGGWAALAPLLAAAALWRRWRSGR